MASTPVADGASAAPYPDAGPAAGALRTVEALRRAGAQRSDPVRFRRLEVLAQRAALAPPRLAGALVLRFERLLAEQAAAHRRSRAAAEATLASLRHQLPDGAGHLDELLAQGELPALERLAGRLLAVAACDAALSPLRGLRAALEPLPPAAGGAQERPAAGAPRELKTLRESRTTWARLAVDRQLSRSLQKTPDNPGPLNSHALVLRALQQMDAISPAYLDRFVSQVETLFWLEQTSFGGPPVSAARPEPAPAVRKPARRRGAAGARVSRDLGGR